MPTEIAFDILLINQSISEIHKQIAGIKIDQNAQNEVINNHSKEQAVFGYRHEQAKQISDKLEKIVERLNEKGEDELRKTIALIDKQENRLADVIISHKDVVLRQVDLQHQTLKQSIDNISKLMDGMGKKQDKSTEDTNFIKKWIWIAIGGVSVLSGFAPKLIALISG